MTRKKRHSVRLMMRTNYIVGRHLTRARRGVRGNQRRNVYWYVVPHLVMEELVRTDRPRRSGTVAAGRGGMGKGAQPA